MNKRRAGLSVIGVAVFAAAIAWSQAAPRGTVNGTVTGSSGPIVGVKVAITSAVSAYTANAVTDKNGTVTFTDVPVGGVGLKAYDESGKVLASGQGTLAFGGQIVNVTVKIP